MPRSTHRSLSTAVGAFVGTAVLLATPGTVVGEEDAPDRPEANPEDVESPEAIVASVYDVISGPASEMRNWDRFRTLFLPETRMIRTGRFEGDATYSVETVEEFIAGAKKAIGGREEGFWEQGVHEITEKFGDIAHVWSTFTVRFSQDAARDADGINSFQLWYDGDRWWIVQSMWFNERGGTRIPERYWG